jgi:3-hydroxy-9,10-secoandrosta-1,3,5(10)-triene-9,17-dione monooxygenase reductase component
LPFRLGPHGTPLLEGCLAHLECELAARFEGGDHSIFLGRVLDGGVDRDGEPLAYFRGRYRRLRPDGA